MAGDPLRDAAAAANAFVNAKPAADSIGVVAFGSHALSLTGFSTSTIDADGALRSISLDPHQGTALYDAIVLASGQLAAQPARGRVLVLLTDGDDTSSRASLDHAIRAARRAGAAVYAIGIAGEGFAPEPLRQLAAATGGRFFLAADSGKLEQVYSTIASELARTWQLTYLTTARPGESIRLRVTVPGQGAAARDVQVPGEPGSAVAPPGPSRLLPESFYRSRTGTLAVALAVGFCLLLGAGLVLAAKKSVWLRQRLEPHVAPSQSRGSRRVRKERFAFAATLIRATERALGNVRHFRALSKRLDRADMPLRAAEFAYIMLGCGIVLGLVVGLATGSVFGLLLGFALGAASPFGFVAFKARKRLKAFDNQLPDLLVTLAASLKAGHSFRQGIQTVVDEGQEPASREFKRVLTDTQLGRPMEDSLSEMAVRVNSKNFSFVINAVTIQRQVGGSLAQLLDMVAETVRQRQQFARRIRSLTAMGRLSAYVLVGLPFFLAFVMSLINRSFMEPLWTRHAGHVLIGIGMTMMLIGSAILKKIVSFKG
jgi:tight adherence protein B